MTDDGIADTLAAMGPRLRTARERHGATLTGVSRATGISLSTLSRIETGRRKPTLEVLLQLAKAYDVSLDELAGTAPAAAAGPRTPAPQRSGNDKTVLPLTRYVGGLHAHKPEETSASLCSAAPRAGASRPSDVRSSTGRVALAFDIGGALRPADRGVRDCGG